MVNLLGELHLNKEFCLHVHTNILNPNVGRYEYCSLNSPTGRPLLDRIIGSLWIIFKLVGLFLTLFAYRSAVIFGKTKWTKHAYKIMGVQG